MAQIIAMQHGGGKALWNHHLLMFPRPHKNNKSGGMAVPAMRWTMIFMGCAAMAINYVDRANLAVAAPFIQKELGINAAVMGVVLGAFFWTYASMQLPFGWFADRVGARIALAASLYGQAQLDGRCA